MLKKTNNNRSTTRTTQMSGNERIMNRTAQRRKKNRRKKIIVRSVLGCVFLLAGIIFVLTMFFNISEITVTGDTVYSSDQVVNESGVNIGDNLIFASKRKINETITTSLPYVGSVKVKRHLPSGLELQITKTDAVYATTADGYFTLLNENGKVLEKDVEYIGENIILLNLGNIVSLEVGKNIELEKETVLDKLFQIREECAECGLEGITAIDLSDIYNIKLVYQGRITLELGETDRSNLPKKLALGQAAIETQDEENEFYRGTINLTVEGKGYWSEETSTTEPESISEESTTEETSSVEESTTEKAA